MSDALFGGCQCGAVRYRADSLRDDSHVCHCRMCQKAVGNFFAALVGVPLPELAWTRGEPAIFRSSEMAERGFCRECGTPLFYRNIESGHISMTTGSFDHPDRILLHHQFGNEGRLPQVDQLTTLPHELTTEEDDPDLVANTRVTNRQHPDRETSQWPPDSD